MSTSLKKNKTPLLIGLTGGIGSGKSTIAKVFESLGVPVFNSDLIAKEIININEEVKKEVSNTFGEQIYAEGKVDTLKLAELIFNDNKALEKLNRIIHPRVGECFEKWVEQNSKSELLIKEAAILIESGAHKKMDKIILITAPSKIRIDRVTKRDNVSERKVLKRMEAQLTDEEKKPYADYIIVNDGKEMIVPQVLEIFKTIKKP